ncbi:hypothetical protein CDL15_Pgr024216 [Punica granatum]|uniref:Protein root UVB sensitive/RUS domain-containing protein n=1 Tax=Punica granatum TaxID=22663 RepID=A0A218XXH8_PUNGR|nr:hypothetical protein CDL15_Pgr024216 [Punica granatum]
MADSAERELMTATSPLDDRNPDTDAIVLEEWNGSSPTKLSRTAVITASPSLSIQRCGNRFSHVWSRVLQAFVPEGFPSSVTPDYLPFQVWDSLQGLSTYIRTMLSTQALLSAIGVGEKSATVIGATFQGSSLDSNAKMWRLVADLMNDLAGVASGATRAALTQHFALQNNAADISAKEGSQETVATMIGMAIGMLLAHVTIGHSVLIWLSFLSLTIFHMYANYKAVQCLALTSLNAKRSAILLQHFMETGQGRYLLVERNGNLSIVAHKDATASDILQSYIHALVEGHLAIDRSSTHSDSQSWIDKNYTEFLQKLKSSGWNTERLLSPSVVWRAHWSFQSLDEKVD